MYLKIFFMAFVVFLVQPNKSYEKMKCLLKINISVLHCTAVLRQNRLIKMQMQLPFQVTRTSGRSAPLVLVPVPNNGNVSHNPSCQSQPPMLVTNPHVSHNRSCQPQPPHLFSPPMLVTNSHVSHNAHESCVSHKRYRRKKIQTP